MFGSDYWMNTLDGDYTPALSEFSAGIERHFGAGALSCTSKVGSRCAGWAARATALARASRSTPPA